PRPGGGPRPEASPAAMSRLIAGKRPAIANPDRDPAGARAVELLRKIGIVVDDGNKAVAVAESTAGVVSLLIATNKAQLGIVYSSDATAGSAVALAMLDLPPIEYVAEVGGGTPKNPQTRKPPPGR